MRKILLVPFTLLAACAGKRAEQSTVGPDVSSVSYTITDSSQGTWRDMEHEVFGDNPAEDDSLKAELRRLFRKKHRLGD